MLPTLILPLTSRGKDKVIFRLLNPNGKDINILNKQNQARKRMFDLCKKTKLTLVEVADEIDGKQGAGCDIYTTYVWQRPHEQLEMI